jgi:hypothetical protein
MQWYAGIGLHIRVFQAVTIASARNIITMSFIEAGIIISCVSRPIKVVIISEYFIIFFNLLSSFEILCDPRIWVMVLLLTERMFVDKIDTLMLQGLI